MVTEKWKGQHGKTKEKNDHPGAHQEEARKLGRNKSWSQRLNWWTRSRKGRRRKRGRWCRKTNRNHRSNTRSGETRARGRDGNTLLLLLLLLHSRLQTPTGRARCQKPKGPSREDSPVRKEKILDRKKNK